MVDEKKISGIGMDGRFEGNALSEFCLHVNIGLNVNMEEPACRMIDQPATSMYVAAGTQFNRTEVLNTLSMFLLELTEQSLYNPSKVSPYAYIRERLLYVGETITVKYSRPVEEKRTGIFKETNKNGHLVLLVDGHEEIVVAGRISKVEMPGSSDKKLATLPGFQIPPEQHRQGSVLATPAHIAGQDMKVIKTPIPEAAKADIETFRGEEAKPKIMATFPEETSLSESILFKERKDNVKKAESPIWKGLKPHKGDIKTNGLSGKEERFYDWDYTHNDIEVYGPHGRQHLGSMDPVTGEIYRPGELGRNIKRKV